MSYSPNDRCPECGRFQDCICEPELICGDSFDHDLNEIDSRDGLTTYECRACGAEIISEDE